MKNLLFWGGLFLATFWDEMLLAATQPKKTKRQQQFIQTGETSQAFIEGISVTKKILSYYFGKPKKIKNTYTSFILKENLAPYYFYRWEVKSFFLDLEKYNDYNLLILRNIDESVERSSFIWEDDIKFELGDVMTYLLYLLESTHLDERYKQLADLGEAGDWELALEIAKGQKLL